MRCSNSAARLPAKTRWVWASTKPGVTQRFSASMMVASWRDFGFEFGVWAGCGDAAVFDQQRCVVDDGEVVEFRAGARACGAGESDELADVDDGDHSGVRKC